MISKKLLYLGESYFNLPDNFDGTCGDALMLLAKYRLRQEKRNKIGKDFVKKEDGEDDMYTSLMQNNKVKCTLQYNILQLNEDGTEYTSGYMDTHKFDR